MNRFIQIFSIHSDLIKKPEQYLSALCQQYDPVLSSFLDKHAPVKNTNSMDDSGHHNLERRWRRSLTHLDRSRYKHQCHLCNRMMTKAKSKYLAYVISENSDNPRRLWNS